MHFDASTVRAKMNAAWDNVTMLSVTVHEICYDVGVGDPSQPTPWRMNEDGFPAYYSAIHTLYWKEPNLLRYHMRETKVGHLEVMQDYDYLAKGSEWWQTVSSYRPVHGFGPVSFARSSVGPTMNPRENSRYWEWINPSVWCHSMQLLPCGESGLPEHPVVHILAGKNFEGVANSQGSPTFFDEGLEPTEGTIFCQLWVDMTSGFFTRLSGESDNGRLWDILVQSLLVNEVAALPPECFVPPTTAESWTGVQRLRC